MEPTGSATFLDLVKRQVGRPALLELYENVYGGLTDEQVAKLDALVWSLYRKEIGAAIFFDRARALSLPQFEEKIWPKLLTGDFFFIADYLNLDLAEFLPHLGEEEIKKIKVLPLEKIIDEIVDARELVLPGDTKKHLLSNLHQYLTGGKNEEETIAALGKDALLGGINLDRGAAEVILNDFQTRWLAAVHSGQLVTQQKIDWEKALAAARSRTAIGGRSGLEETNAPAKTEKIASKTHSFVPSMQLYDQLANEIIRESGVQMEPELEQRLKFVVVSRLKDVRKLSETRERLLSPALAGGVGLIQVDADKLIKMIEEARLQGEKIQSKKKEEKSKVAVKREPEDIMSAMDRRPMPLVKTPKPPSTPATSADTRRPLPAMLKIESASGAEPAKVKFTALPELPPKPNAKVLIPQVPSGRAKVEDVAYQMRLKSPVEELGEMTLLDFHRLSPKTQVAIDKVYAKIEILGQEGLDKKIKGAKAWQGSPVYKIYTALLTESLLRGVAVDQMIAERQKQKQETLTSEEFKAIVLLNKKIGV